MRAVGAYRACAPSWIAPESPGALLRCTCCGGAGADRVGRVVETFKNWSGSVEAAPSARPQPKDAGEVARIVSGAREAGQRVRPVGSGHSSTPLVVTDDVMVALDDMHGVVSADPDQSTATILPGTGLSDLGAELAEHGLAMKNYGDVDYQTIAGSISTGTHGSGKRIGNLSSFLVGGTLIDGRGEAVPFGTEAGRGEDDELLRAARVSLGTLGIFTSMTIRLQQAFNLHRLNWMTHIDWVMENFDELIDQNRSLDFYWYPRSDLAQVRMLNEPGNMPELTPPGTLKLEETGPSYDIIPNSRALKFEEMEYMLPLEAGMDAFNHVRKRIKEKHRKNVGWRVLVRTIAPDNAMLSNAHGRPTMTIALLQNHTLPYKDYFDDMEPILQDFDGRPHWAKKHTMKAEQLKGHYPEWDRFLQIRRELDPDGVFLNDYLRELLGLGKGES